jgi:hydroxymethylpyrimidine/phosphomethylpyrimidine kinase
VTDEGQGKVTKPRMTQAQRDHLRENASVFAPNVQETIHLLDDAAAYARLREGLNELERKRHNIHIGSKTLTSEWINWKGIRALLDG